MRGWVWVWRLAKETARGFQADDCNHMAAGIAYYALFSIFPLLLGLIAVLGLVLEPAEIQPRLIELTAQVFPSSRELVARNVEGVVASRQALGVASLAGLLWSGTAIFGAIRRSLNRAWRVKRERPLLTQKLLELGMVGAVGLLFLASVALTAAFHLVWRLLPTELRTVAGGPLWSLGAVVVPLGFSFGIFALVYRFVPNALVTWKGIWPGALLAAGLFEAAKNVFAWFLANVASYSLVYGSLEAVIAFLLWAYLSALILLLGAELASAYSRMSG